MDHKFSIEDLIQRVAQMSAEQKEAFAGRTLALVESAGFEGLSIASQERCWLVLDLCTQ